MIFVAFFTGSLERKSLKGGSIVGTGFLLPGVVDDLEVLVVVFVVWLSVVFVVVVFSTAIFVVLVFPFFVPIVVSSVVVVSPKAS